MINITAEEFDLISKFIHEHSGIHLKAEKKTLLIGRLNSLLLELNLDSFMAFYQRLIKEKDGVLLSKLIDKVSTNHTYFMRENEHFLFLQNEVLPYFKNNLRTRDLRVWCAASSSGEEPYTLAMILEDYFGKELLQWDKKLLATDISVEVLDIAKKGEYTPDKITNIPRLWALSYFDKLANGNFQINAKLRSQVIYRRFNLLEPVFPFKKKFHVIFCRNVMIYFDNKTKNELVEKFYDLLELGGFLFIGHSESIDRNQSRFKYIKPAVYRKV